MREYRDVLTLPGSLTLDDLVVVLDKIREHGSGELGPTIRRISVLFVQEDDWDMRGVLADVQFFLRSYGVEWEVDKAKFIGV